MSPTALKDRLMVATEWLQATNKLGMLGEFAGGDNVDCIAAMQQGLEYMGENDDVWTGAIWWAAGPWWGDYIFTMEPPSGLAYTDILPKIMPYD